MLIVTLVSPGNPGSSHCAVEEVEILCWLNAVSLNVCVIDTTRNINQFSRENQKRLQRTLSSLGLLRVPFRIVWSKLSVLYIVLDSYIRPLQ